MTMTHDSMCDTVTLTSQSKDDTITVSMGGLDDLSIDTLTTVTLKDNTCDTFTLDDIYLSDYGTSKNEIKVGNRKLGQIIIPKKKKERRKIC